MVPEVIVDRAVVAAASTLCSRRYLNRAGTVLSGIVAGLDLDLLHHIRVCGNDAAVIRADVHHSRAVDRDHVLLASHTVYVILVAGIGA